MMKIKAIFISIILIINFSSASNSQNIPNSFADLAEKLMPSVVNISTTQTVVTRSNPFPNFQFPGQFHLLVGNEQIFIFFRFVFQVSQNSNSESSIKTKFPKTKNSQKKTTARPIRPDPEPSPPNPRRFQTCARRQRQWQGERHE